MSTAERSVALESALAEAAALVADIRKTLKLPRRTVRTADAEFESKHPRDDSGKFTDGAVADFSVGTKDGPWYIEHAKPVVERVAKAMGVDPGMVDLVSKEPPVFKVGNRTFAEAGHYDPSTGRIEINVAQLSVGGGEVGKSGLSVSQEKEIAEYETHEVMHAIVAEAAKAMKEESQAESDLYQSNPLHPENTQYGHARTAYDELVYASGEVKPGQEAEMRRLFPVKSMFADAGVDVGFFFPTPGKSPNNSYQDARKRNNDLRIEGGFSPYSEAYWKAYETFSGTQERALNETLAEVARIQLTGRRPNDLEPPPAWAKLAQSLRLWYRDQQKKRDKKP